MCEKCEEQRQEFIAYTTGVCKSLCDVVFDPTDENVRTMAERMSRLDTVDEILEMDAEMRAAFAASYLAINLAYLNSALMKSDVPPAILMGQWAGLMLQSEMETRAELISKLANDARFN